MSAKWKSFLKMGIGVAGVMVPGVAQAEAAFTAIKAGKDKKAAVIAMTKGGLLAAEWFTNKDLVNDEEFSAALGELNDALVKIAKVVDRHEK